MLQCYVCYVACLLNTKLQRDPSAAPQRTWRCPCCLSRKKARWIHRCHACDVPFGGRVGVRTSRKQSVQCFGIVVAVHHQSCLISRLRHTENMSWLHGSMIHLDGSFHISMSRAFCQFLQVLPGCATRRRVVSGLHCFGRPFPRSLAPVVYPVPRRPGRASRRGGILADEMGMGKTIQAGGRGWKMPGRTD